MNTSDGQRERRKKREGEREVAEPGMRYKKNKKTYWALSVEAGEAMERLLARSDGKGLTWGGEAAW